MDTARALSRYLEDWTPEAWDWGHAHCGAFVAGWIRTATGRDALAGLHAARTLDDWRAAVAGDMAALVSRQLGCESVAPKLAHSGDVVLLAGSAFFTGGALGICSGRYAVVLDEQAWCRFVPLRMFVTHAWPLRLVRAEVAA